MEKDLKNNEGFILKIVVVIVALVALKYVFHIDILAWLKTPTAQKIIQPAWTAIKNLYEFIDNFFRNKLT